jgi:ABC-type nitrate/sulfonate/bicarbonate transport system permease component
MMTAKWWNGRVLGLILILVLLALWEVSVKSGMTQSLSFPPISSVFKAWWKLIYSGVILEQLGASLYRMFIGYFIAAFCGITLGLLMGYFRIMDNLLEPLVELLRPIPTPAYIPVAILLLGLGTEMKVFLIAAATFFPILLNTYSGVKHVDAVQIDTGRTFGLNAFNILRKIIFPSAIPHVFTGLRISLGIGLIMVVISEMVAANSGIGYFILQAQRSFEVAQMYAGIFTLGIVGYLLNFIFIRIEKRIVHWS